MEKPPVRTQLPLPFEEDEEAARLQQEVEGRRLKLLRAKRSDVTPQVLPGR